MLLFLAGVVEQLDLALEHIAKRDVHNARFGLMMTDNAVELMLHKMVKDKRVEAGSWRYCNKPYPYESQLRKAFLGSFSDKVAFALIEGGLDAKCARTFNILHNYRNDVYHAGLAHEGILLSLARFYFYKSCVYLSHYQPMGIGWSSGQKMPVRVQKYFNGDRTLPGEREDFADACKAMATAITFDPAEISEVLADDMDQIIEYMDTCIQIVADGVYQGQQTTRNQAIIDTQAWGLAFSDEGKAFVANLGFKGQSVRSVDLLVKKYHFPFRHDPIPKWRERSKKLRSKVDPDKALESYQSFVTTTGPLRLSTLL
ncbi:hypothetical protein H845_746 [Komagataeibacter xylinus E25]|nr:hypothetical protein H845_746 [Komagataeibacter xylinus E25]